MNETTMTPLQADIAVERISDQNSQRTNIYIRDDDKTNIQHYNVVAVGPDVTKIEVGDEVILSWSNITPPFEFDSKKIGITNEREVLGVVEPE